MSLTIFSDTTPDDPHLSVCTVCGQRSIARIVIERPENLGHPAGQDIKLKCQNAACERNNPAQRLSVCEYQDPTE